MKDAPTWWVHHECGLTCEGTENDAAVDLIADVNRQRCLASASETEWSEDLAAIFVSKPLRDSP